MHVVWFKGYCSCLQYMASPSVAITYSIYSECIFSLWWLYHEGSLSIPFIVGDVWFFGKTLKWDSYFRYNRGNHLAPKTWHHLNFAHASPTANSVSAWTPQHLQTRHHWCSPWSNLEPRLDGEVDCWELTPELPVHLCVSQKSVLSSKENAKSFMDSHDLFFNNHIPHITMSHFFHPSWCLSAMWQWSPFQSRAGKGALHQCQCILRSYWSRPFKGITQSDRVSWNVQARKMWEDQLYFTPNLIVWLVGLAYLIQLWNSFLLKE